MSAVFLLLLCLSILYEFACSVYALPVNGAIAIVFNILLLLCLPYLIQYKSVNLVLW